MFTKAYDAVYPLKKAYFSTNISIEFMHLNVYHWEWPTALLNSSNFVPQTDTLKIAIIGEKMILQCHSDRDNKEIAVLFVADDFMLRYL